MDSRFRVLRCASSTITRRSLSYRHIIISKTGHRSPLLISPPESLLSVPTMSSRAPRFSLSIPSLLVLSLLPRCSALTPFFFVARHRRATILVTLWSPCMLCYDPRVVDVLVPLFIFFGQLCFLKAVARLSLLLRCCRRRSSCATATQRIASLSGFHFCPSLLLPHRRPP